MKEPDLYFQQLREQRQKLLVERFVLSFLCSLFFLPSYGLIQFFYDFVLFPCWLISYNSFILVIALVYIIHFLHITTYLKAIILSLYIFV